MNYDPHPKFDFGLGIEARLNADLALESVGRASAALGSAIAGHVPIDHAYAIRRVQLASVFAAAAGGHADNATDAEYAGSSMRAIHHRDQSRRLVRAAAYASSRLRRHIARRASA